jgi:carboxymethylenebutenolidase
VYDDMMAESVRIAGHGGHVIAAYFARPLGPRPYPGVVVIHHMPRWDDGMRRKGSGGDRSTARSTAGG